MKRTFRAISVLPILIAAPAFAQVNGQLTLTNAMTWLSQQTIVYVQMTGQQTTGSTTKQFDYEGYITRFKIGPDGSPQPTFAASLYLDLEGFQVNGTTFTPLTRIVADGNILWKYIYPDAPYGTGGLNNSYSSTNYRTDPSVPVGDKALSALSGITDQFSDEIALLFKQGFASSGPNFQTWIGGAAQSSASTANTIIYTNATSQITYNVSYDLTGETNLDSVSYKSNTTVAGSPVATTWTMTVLPLLKVSSAKFQFVPPAGSMPIATSHTNGS